MGIWGPVNELIFDRVEAMPIVSEQSVVLARKALQRGRRSLARALRVIAEWLETLEAEEASSHKTCNEDLINDDEAPSHWLQHIRDTNPDVWAMLRRNRTVGGALPTPSMSDLSSDCHQLLEYPKKTCSWDVASERHSKPTEVEQGVTDKEHTKLAPARKMVSYGAENNPLAAYEQGNEQGESGNKKESNHFNQRKDGGHFFAPREGRLVHENRSMYVPFLKREKSGQGSPIKADEMTPSYPFVRNASRNRQKIESTNDNAINRHIIDSSSETDLKVQSIFCEKNRQMTGNRYPQHPQKVMPVETMSATKSRLCHPPTHTSSGREVIINSEITACSEPEGGRFRSSFPIGRKPTPLEKQETENRRPDFSASGPHTFSGCLSTRKEVDQKIGATTDLPTFGHKAVGHKAFADNDSEIETPKTDLWPKLPQSADRVIDDWTGATIREIKRRLRLEDEQGKG